MSRRRDCIIKNFKSLSATYFSLYDANPFDGPDYAMFADYLKIISHYVAPKKALTMLAGLLAEVQTPHIKNYLIRHFIQRYAVNMQEAREEHPECYASFNDFFIRSLKPGARPMARADLVSPVDGCVSEIGDISKGQLLQAKNRYYTVKDLLASDDALSALFENGRFATLYLSPKDYHRVHMPLQGTLSQTIHVPGKLFSVQPLTTRLIPQLFSRNERLVVLFNTKIGMMAMVMVGATIVGSIGTSWHGDVLRNGERQCIDYTQGQLRPIVLQQGAEMGYFKLGSTVVLLFAEGRRMQWNASLQAGSRVRLAEAMGQFTS